MQFRHRRDAGRILAERLARTLTDDAVTVIALPRGGVPVGFEITRVLGVPLDVLAVRKLGAPGQPEYGVGAIAEGEELVIDRREADRVGLSGEVLDRKVAIEQRELARRARAYRGARPMVDVRGRTVVLVDDGLATGLTMLVAIQAMRNRGAARIIVAVPVAAADAVERVGARADDVIAVLVPPRFHGVGEWYRDFAQTDDDEVIDLLARSRAMNTGEFAAVVPRA